MITELIKFYELNEKYHDTKEKMAWLATSLYVAFSIALFKWIIAKQNNSFITSYCFYVLLFLSMIFGCALWFINFQYIKKRASVKIEEKITQEMCKLNVDGIAHITELFDFISYINKRNGKERKYKYHSTEIPINVIVTLFFLAKVAMTLVVKLN